MRYRSVALIVLLLVPAAVATEDAPVSFSTPGQIQGTVEAEEAKWVMIRMAANGAPWAELQVTPGESYSESALTYRTAKAQYSSTPATFSYPTETSEQHYQIHDEGLLKLTPARQESGYLLLRGADFSLNFDSVGASLWSLPADECLYHEYEQWFASSDIWLRTDVCVEEGAAILKTDPSGRSKGTLTGQVDWVEWQGLHATCLDASPCPGSTTTVSRRVAGVDGAETYDETHRWVNLEGAHVPVAVDLQAADVLFIGNLELALDGVARLPQLSAPACEACGQGSATGTFGGELILDDLHPAGSHGSLHTNLGGEAAWVRLDEEPMKASLLFGYGAAATAAGTLIGLLYKFLAPLFTRISPEKALQHPRRKHLFAYIEGNPGGTFRELIRGTDIPAGTARHHLNIMERTGLVVEKRHKSTLRFFPNHGQYDDTWDAVVMLREEPLAELHAWVRDHPECMQKEMLAAMSDRGWSRSTTQHRLHRLIDGGLVTVRPQGRIKRYTAHDRVQRPSGQEAWTGLTHFTPGEGTPSTQGSL